MRTQLGEEEIYFAYTPISLFSIEGSQPKTEVVQEPGGRAGEEALEESWECCLLGGSSWIALPAFL